MGKHFIKQICIIQKIHIRGHLVWFQYVLMFNIKRSALYINVYDSPLSADIHVDKAI